MKKTMSLLALVGILVTGIGSAFAFHQEGYQFIRKVQADSNNNVLGIAVTGNFSPSHGCTKPYWAFSQHSLDHPGTKAMLQIALSSFLSRKQVYITTNGCTASGYPILTNVMVAQD